VDRRLGALACIGLTSLLSGCGGGGGHELLSETGVRECLAGAHFGPHPTPSNSSDWAGYAPIFVPDFTAESSDGTGVAIIVQGSAKRAEETSANVRSAFASLGGSAARADRVIASQNAVAVFSRSPTAAERRAVRSCLAG
jgi:hypothetical protein